MNTTLSSTARPNYVKLDHGGGLTTSYFHMKKNSVAVSVGQVLKAGQQIGSAGSSGYSTAPHLHFQSEINGVVFEPFAGSCHGGVSSWITQPSFRTDLYLRELVLTGDNLGNRAGYPFDTSRTGTFLTGTRSVGFWCVLGNGDSLRKISLRYLRPDGSVALAPAPYTTNSFFRNGTFDFYYTFNLDVTGLWHLEISINDQIVASAPFTVISSGSPVNHAPGSVQAVFDPAAPTSGDVLFSRITSSTLLLDPDYDLPRFHYLWQVNSVTVRDVIGAGLADAIPRNSANTGDTVTCTITPSDGINSERSFDGGVRLCRRARVGLRSFVEHLHALAGTGRRRRVDRRNDCHRRRCEEGDHSRDRSLACRRGRPGVFARSCA